MSELTVRAYNVYFGDAILVSIPETQDGGEITRHLLIDVGNLLASPNDVFVPVVDDIRKRVGGVVDLYVMTHEHLDHVQGLLEASRRGVQLTARHAWLTGSAAPDYYVRHPTARKQLGEALASVARYFNTADDPWLDMMIRNNSLLMPTGALGLRTGDYVDHLRGLAGPDNTHYVDRATTPLETLHPFREAKLRILAPEPDVSSYYGRARPRLTAASADAANAAPPPARRRPAKKAQTPPLQPPVGIDAGAFFDLVRDRANNARETVLQIDKAANNTSIVLEIEWRGWRLLFGGDAETRSWTTILAQDLLRPVHVIKLSHHGSHNGTTDAMLDAALPAPSPDGRARWAIVSTHDDDWASVPDGPTLGLYSERATLLDTRTVAPGKAVEVRLPG